jgi:N-methylhydantoinase B/oxoprolinase/acetone carboxylase alpha subunit
MVNDENGHDWAFAHKPQEQWSDDDWDAMIGALRSTADQISSIASEMENDVYAREGMEMFSYAESLQYLLQPIMTALSRLTRAPGSEG